MKLLEETPVKISVQHVNSQTVRDKGSRLQIGNCTRAFD